MYVAFARDAERVSQRPGGPSPTPIDLTGPTGAPLFAAAAENLAPGASVVIDADDFGHPVQSLRDVPAGRYWVQPFVNVYTRFARQDGHTVWMHMDQWEGQNWKRSPGNLYGDPVQVTFDPKSTTPITLVADKVIAPITVPDDTDHVKRFRMRSRILSEWWGHPIYVGATVLLPRDYARHPATRYPAVYFHGHFSTGAPAGFGRGGDFDKYWMADGTPQMIYITLQHPSPYYDDSYGVNSDALPRGPRAMGAVAQRRLDRRLDCARSPDLLSGLLRRHVLPVSRQRRLPCPPNRQRLRRCQRLLS
jgi:hypothetical protein